MTKTRNILATMADKPMTPDQVCGFMPDMTRKNMGRTLRNMRDNGHVQQSGQVYTVTADGKRYMETGSPRKIQRPKKRDRKAEKMDAEFKRIPKEKAYKSPRILTNAYKVSKAAEPLRNENVKAAEKTEARSRPAPYAEDCWLTVPIKGVDRKCAGVGTPKVGDPVCPPCWERITADRTKKVNA